ncbi:ATP synthase subunit I [Paenibacillus soyae]|uniref:ATP synthase subunit I n=1 Tax=Paenibacillus soyae TaxID=2969249 RepID=A0A9X2MVY7_9BACL|nr:ATP synthase subunit I [Paenibacillus soyae]MCR2807465.1 ATP synthase subunit I [Paenibacillus soyae]
MVDNIFKTAMRWALIFAAACLLLWVIMPEWKSVCAGLLLGVFASFLNALMLRRRVEIVGQAAGGNRRMGMGLGSRIAMVLLVAMVAYKNPETFNLPATLAASMVMPFFTLVSAFLHHKRH